MFDRLSNRAYSMYVALHLAIHFGITDLLPSLPRGDEGSAGLFVTLGFWPFFVLFLLIIIF